MTRAYETTEGCAGCEALIEARVEPLIHPIHGGRYQGRWVRARRFPSGRYAGPCGDESSPGAVASAGAPTYATEAGARADQRRATLAAYGYTGEIRCRECVERLARETEERAAASERARQHASCAQGHRYHAADAVRCLRCGAYRPETGRTPAALETP